MPVTNYDVIIVGAGPAGTACAGELVKSGLRTLILDKAEFPRLKLCAGWVTPKVFRQLGISPEKYPESILLFKRLYFYFYGIRIPLPTRQYSIRRVEFDHWLLKRSQAEFRRHAVNRIERSNESFIIDGLYCSKYLVGAGGTNCPVYKSIFHPAEERQPGKRIVTIEHEFKYDYTDPNCYLWFFENKLPGYSWYVPKGNGYLNIGIGGNFNALKAQGRTIKEYWAYFVEKLARKKLVNVSLPVPRGHNYYLRGALSTGQRGNAYLLGDALGLATTDMGEGIGPAIESGILAARSILENKPYRPDSIGRYSFRSLLFPEVQSGE